MKSFRNGMLVLCVLVAGMVAEYSTGYVEERRATVVEKAYLPPSDDLTLIPDGQGNLIPIWSHRGERYRVIVRDETGATTSTQVAAEQYGRIHEGDSARVGYLRGGLSGFCYLRRVR